MIDTALVEPVIIDRLEGKVEQAAHELLRAGVPNHTTVSFRVGHSTVAVTKGRYAHVLPSIQQRAVKVTNKLLKRNDE